MASGNFSNYNITITIDIPNVSKLNSAINSALSGVTQTVKQTKNISKNFSATAKNATNTNNNINKLNVNLAKARRQSSGFLKDWERLTIVANQLAELTRKAVIFFNLLMKPVSESASFEQFRVTLKNLLGDIDAADNRFREMVRFAAKTPFNVPGVVEAGNRLQSIGKYSLKTIEMLGDLAAASGKDISQAIEAYTNLAVGRTGMAVKQFRALLISNVDWSREIGKQVLKNTGETTASVQEMLDALPKIIAKKGFSKLMEEQSKTLNGIISNFEDSVQRAFAAIGDKILPQVKKLYLSLIEFFDKLEKNSTKVFKILQALGKGAYFIGLIYGFKQISKLVTVIGMQFINLKRFFISFKTSATTIGSSLKSLFFTLNLIKGTIQQSTIASINWARAIGVLGTRLAIAGRALFALAGKIGIVIFAISAVVDLIKSTKKVFEEDLDERIENMEQTLQLQKDYKDRQVEQLNLYEQRIAALNELINVEKKYSSEIRKKEEELKKSNASEEQQKIVLQKTREGIEEYNTALEKLKSVYPELIGKQNEFGLANETNEKTLNKLGDELKNSKLKFFELKDSIISTTEAIVNLRIELAKLNLQKQMEETKNKVTESLNQLPTFDSILESLINILGINTEKSSQKLSEIINKWISTLNKELNKPVEKIDKKAIQEELSQLSDAKNQNFQKRITLINKLNSELVKGVDANAINSLELINKYLNSLNADNIEEATKQVEELMTLLNNFDKKKFVEGFTTAVSNILKIENKLIDKSVLKSIEKQGIYLFEMISKSALNIYKSIDDIKLQYAEGFRDFFSNVITYHQKYLSSIYNNEKTVQEELKKNLQNIQKEYEKVGTINLKVMGKEFELRSLIASIPNELKFKDANGNDVELKQYLSDQLDEKIAEMKKNGKFDISTPLTMEFKIPNLKDQIKGIDSVLNEIFSKIDLILEGLEEENRASVGKRLESLKNTLTQYKIMYESMMNNFRNEMDKISSEYTSKKPVKVSKDFLVSSFDIYKQTFENFNNLIKDFRQKSKYLEEEIKNLQGSVDNDSFGLLNTFNELNKKFLSFGEDTTKILTDTLEKFKDFVIDSRELAEQGLLLPSELGFKSGDTEEVINFIEEYAENINKAVNDLSKTGVKFDRNALLKSITIIYDNIEQLKAKLREEKAIKIKLEDFFKILPPDKTTSEEIKEYLENNLLGYLKNLTDNYEVPIQIDIKPEIPEETKKQYEKIIKNDINYLIEKINKDFAEEDNAINLIINQMRIDNKSEVDINEKLISQYKERQEYLYEIISLIKQTKTEEEEQLEKVKERIAQLEKLKEVQTLTKEETEDLEKQKIKEDELNKELLKRVEILQKLVELLKQLGIKTKEAEQNNENAFGKKLGKFMNEFSQVYTAVYDNLNKIGQAYFENMINNARKEAQIYLELQNQKLDADEKFAMNYARTELQREKVRERIEEKRKEAQEKARKMELDARRKQFEFEKKMAVAQALMNIAVAVTKIFAENGTLGFIIAAAAEAFLNAVYIPIILSQEFPEYREGGYTGNLKEDEPAGIVHGKEFVVNAKATKKHRPLLEKINKDKLDDKTYKKGGYVGSDNNNSLIENNIENIKKLKNDINSINDMIANIGRKEIYNTIKLKLKTETEGLNKINIKGQLNEFDKQIILSRNQSIKLPAVNNKINISNDSLLSEIKTLNNNLKYYLENPAPAIAYLDENEAEKITKVGFKKIQRKLI